MKFTLTTPCGDCPFRSDGKGIRLRSVRAAEIFHAITAEDKTFACHKTVDYNNEDDEIVSDFRVPKENEQHCAGALILLEKLDQPNQMMRICERIGMYDRRGLKMDAPVFGSKKDFMRFHCDQRRTQTANRRTAKKARGDARK